MEFVPLQGKKHVNIDTMLNRIGEFGPYQWLVETILCIMIIPRTYQILLMYFAALNPPWRCVTNSTSCLINTTMEYTNKLRCNIPRSEWEYTQPKDYSIVTQFDIYCDNEWQIYLTTSIVFIGWAIGAVVTGWIADNYGRKIVIFPCEMLILTIGLISAFMPSIYPLIFCRFVIGFCLPGVGVQMFILISELVGYKSRPFTGNTLWFFFTVALCITALKAFFIRKWKILIISLTAPYLFVAVFYKLVPESFRWLYVKGRYEEAVDILKKIAKWNKKEYPNDIILEQPPIISAGKKSSITDLFRTRKWAICTIVQGICWFVNAMVYYGLSLAADDLGGSLYTNFVLVSIVEFPAAILAVYLCNTIGRKKTVIIPMLIGSIACMVIAAIPENAKIARITLGMLGKFCITISFDSIYIWAVEIFPTSFRANGMAFLQITSRMGAASSPWVGKALKSLYTNLPFIVMGACAFISGCSLFILEETKGKQETMEIEQNADEAKETLS